MTSPEKRRRCFSFLILVHLLYCMGVTIATNALAVTDEERKEKGLKTLVKYLDDHEVLMAEGLNGGSGPKKLGTVVKAVLSLQSKNRELTLNRGVIVPMLSHWAEGEWRNFQFQFSPKEAKKVKIVSITDPELIRSIYALGSDETLVVQVGEVPEGFRKHFIKKSTYPVLTRGQENYRLVSEWGKSYLPLASADFSDAPDRVRKIREALSHQEVATVKTYFLKLRDPQSKASRYFQRQTETMRQKGQCLPAALRAVTGKSLRSKGG